MTENLPELTKASNFLDISKQIIEKNENQELLKNLFMKIFDQDFELTKKLYDKLESQNLIDEITFNNYVWSAAHFDQK
jgi:hypothetical protein